MSSGPLVLVVLLYLSDGITFDQNSVKYLFANGIYTSLKFAYICPDHQTINSGFLIIFTILYNDYICTIYLYKTLILAPLIFIQLFS